MSNSLSDNVTIIICTLAERERTNSLWRAIESLRKSSVVQPQIHIVVNGLRFDPALLVKLQRQPDLHLIQIPEGSLRLARRTGRASVTTEFFGFLDDDDEYLPGAIDARVSALDQHHDVVVTNGYAASRPGVLFLDKMSEIEADPVGTLLASNWMPSCGALFRSAAIGQEYFDDMPEYFEWTWIAYRVAVSGKRIRALDAPTFVIHDTPDSASKSMDYRTASVNVLRKMRAVAGTARARRVINRKISHAFHELADYHYQLGNKRLAWEYHTKSLGSLHGLRYLSFTRRLIGAK